MSASDRVNDLQVFAKALQDRPLDPALPEDAKLYVRELHAQQMDGLNIDPVIRLSRQIERAAGSRVWLFTGNIGSGKSTELRRLRQELQQKGCVVFLADAAEYTNLNQKIEVSDFLISVTAAFAEQAGSFLGENQVEESYWQRIRHFLLKTEVDIKEISAGVGAELSGPVKLSAKTDLKLALRQDPSVKQILQTRLKGHLSSLADELERYRGDILARIRAKAGADTKVVVLLDSLERLRGSGDSGDEVFSSVRSMFTQFHDMLRLHDVQVVYSVAPYLLKLAPQLNGLFGAGTVCHLTSAHVFKNRCRQLDLQGGVAVIREIIRRRYAAWEQLIPSEVMDQIIENSGGDLRDLFRLLSIVLLELEFSDNVPAVLAFALEQVRRDMSWVTEPQKARLRYLAEHKQPRLNDEADMDALVHDLETKRVLMYRNGEDWYDIHPLLRSLLEPAAGAASGGN